MAEQFDVSFGKKGINVGVNIGAEEAIQVPVYINSLDAEKVGKEVGDRIAAELGETIMKSVAKESTLNDKTDTIAEKIGEVLDKISTTFTLSIVGQKGRHNISLLGTIEDVQEGSTAYMEGNTLHIPSGTMNGNTLMLANARLEGNTLYL